MPPILLPIAAAIGVGARIAAPRFLAPKVASNSLLTNVASAVTAGAGVSVVNTHTDFLRLGSGAQVAEHVPAQAGADYVVGSAGQQLRSVKLTLPNNASFSAPLPLDHISQSAQRYVPLSGGSRWGGSAPFPHIDVTLPLLTGKPVLDLGGRNKLPGFSPVQVDLKPQGFTPEWVDARLEGTPATVVAGPQLLLSEGRFVGSKDWKTLHPQTGGPVYHGPGHSKGVGEAHRRVVRALGETDPAAIEFNGQVADVHDLDPDRVPGKPPVVARTVQLLRDDFSGQQKLLDGGTRSLTRGEYGWTEQDLNVAVAQILRTDFPFDANKQATYENALRQLKESGMSDAELKIVMLHAAALSEISDKASTYFMTDFETALDTTYGLIAETGLPAQVLKPHEFLARLENPDYSADAAIAKNLGIEFTPPVLAEVITPEQLQQLRSNQAKYQEMFGN